MYLVPNMKVCLSVLFFNLVISVYLLWIAFKAFPLRFLVVFNEYGWGFRLQWFIDFPRVGFYVPNIKLCFELLWLSSTWKNSSMSQWVGMAVDIPQKHLFTNIIFVSANSASVRVRLQVNCLLVVILIKGSLNLGTLCNTGCENKHVVSLVSLDQMDRGWWVTGCCREPPCFGTAPVHALYSIILTDCHFVSSSRILLKKKKMSSSRVYNHDPNQ